jgi:oxygen-dependent protoporphyrinogen oxidase
MKSRDSTGVNKNIVIIGGGISGLCLLYFLKKKYAGRGDIRFILFEKNAYLGGNIRTLSDHGALFECGPNGFLNNQPAMLDLIKELGLSSELIFADPAAKKRFVLVNNALHSFPASLIGLFKFKPFSLFGKLRVFLEPFIKKGRDPDESVHQFFRRRFGRAVAKYLADPMVSGIYGGNSEFLNIQSAFPKVYEMEQQFGSVIRGMMASRGSGVIKSGLHSFRGGMQCLINALSTAGGDSIHVNEPVREVIPADRFYLVVTDKDKYTADELYITAPSFVAGRLLEKSNADLAQALMAIEYAPIAVVGLLFDKSAFLRVPEGFGYLIPSSEKKKVLGVLAESNIFYGRAGSSQMMLRIMIGGVRNFECSQMSQEQLVELALRELNDRFGLVEGPLARFVCVYPRAIPQYEMQYPALKNRIKSALASFKRLHLLSNYLDGVSTNDCVKNAQVAASRSDV